MYCGQRHNLLQQLWAMQHMYPRMLPTGLQDVKAIRNIPEFPTSQETSSGGRNQDYEVGDHFLMYLLPLLPGPVVPPPLHNMWDITVNPVPHLGTFQMTFQVHSEALWVLPDLQIHLEPFRDFLLAFRAHPEISLASLGAHLDLLDLLDLPETFRVFHPLLRVALQDSLALRDNQGLLEYLPHLPETFMCTLHGHMHNLHPFRCSGTHMQLIPSRSLEGTQLVWRNSSLPASWSSRLNQYLFLMRVPE